MKEKVLIKSERYGVGNICMIMVIIGAILSLILSFIFRGVLIIMFLFCLVPLALIGGLCYLWLRSYELTVTDMRIYGKVAFGKRVDLPVDSVSAVGTSHVLKGVSVSTASGRISFLAIKNADEIYMVMNNLLIERQQKKYATTNSPQSSADELKKLKELLDLGIISQEEFETKKKELLEL